MASTQRGQMALPGAKGKGRKAGKQPPAQKKPGRGMGVAQLERMRIQESWKLIGDLNPVQTGFAVQGVAPIRCGELHALNAGLYSLSPQAGPAHCFPRPGPFHVDSGSCYCGPGDQIRARVGGFRPELPSIPNPESDSWGEFDFNGFTFKKKRVLNGEDIVGGTRENKCYQGAEILAVHRKGVGRRNMVMEYGFFPANSSSSLGAGESGSSSASTAELYGGTYPYGSSIDLSLRL